MNHNHKWNKNFIELAQLVSTWSKDPSTKVGVVIVDDQKRIVSIGYNGFPRGVEDTEERYDNRPIKYEFVVHAEINSIMNSPRTDLKDCTIYCTDHPCNNCMKAIVQTGIKEIIYLNDLDLNRYDVSAGQDMCVEANINIVKLKI